MKFVFEKGIHVLQLDLISTLGLAALVYLLGRVLVNRVGFLSRFCIPAPVAGGFLFSILMWILHSTQVLSLKMDTTLQSPFMLAFFTSIGLTASLRMVKQGGKLLLGYWFLCSLLALMQNLIGVSLAQVLDIHPLLGVLMGAVSMEGGHGAAGAFGPEIESMGIHGAAAVALAAATFGLVSGGLVGGPIAKYLIGANDLKSEEGFRTVQEQSGEVEMQPKMGANTFILHMAIIAICITVGVTVAKFLKVNWNIALPGYVGAMFFAVILRNLNDMAGAVKLRDDVVNLIGDISLGIFLSMALMTLKLWELADLAVPMFVILFAQVAFIVFYTVVIAFRALGKSYDAAIICAGMAGHGLGATPNGIANMTAVTEKYGHSTRAFMIVPLCGAFLIDLFGIPCIVWFINHYKPM